MIPKSNSSHERETAMSLLFRVRGTVILKIWPHILLLTGYTIVIVGLHNYVIPIKFPIALIFVLGLVTGMLLVFRTTTAYDRYWEGRCLFSKLESHSRSITRSIWSGVSAVDENGEQEVKTLIEKLTAINLLVAFAYATKYYLREEFSYEEEELKYKISHLPRFRKPKFPTQFFHGGMGEGKCGHEENKKEAGIFCVHPPQKDECGGTNIPIEISYYLFSYLKMLRKKGLAHGSCVGLMYWSVSVLIECLTGFERILRTPIPIAYNVHLQQCVWLYLLAVPYQLVGFLNWLTIPAMILASFALLGILGIGREIENPFGYDDNDLPLDIICRVILREIQMIVGNPMPSLESWTLSKANFPVGPSCGLSAEELLGKPLHELRNLLADAASAQYNFPSTQCNLKTDIL